ncbi:type I phosphomannose isomerase catalytic subunit [Brevibacillus massiliensis]|jgi:mannose-6-phosphate isomerase|uniref:type I phosphomannose isomerase catalytic subunit n=1 Tax=Brevibacillus massiliensis TaxID=1118054 RepID=UPI0002FD3D94|nr:type I phosphomannose isomerase catalytic subunit [Brevibacillus massiliensis]
MHPYPVKFHPIAKERVWGGHRLKPRFGQEGKQPIGEYWVLSGHPHGTSVVKNGPFAGKSLADLTSEYPGAYLGRSPQGRFPLLIKFLEATEHLSVQIHPDDRYAQEREGDFGKSEAWYVLDHEPGARITCGHTLSSEHEYRRALREKRIREYLLFREVRKGDMFFIPARTLHALLAGTVVIEIQQASDVTYRIYDWDRVDSEGRGRELHIDQAAEVMLYGAEAQQAGDPVSPKLLRRTDCACHEQLLACPFFTVERLLLTNGSSCFLPSAGGNPEILIVAEGSGLLWADGEPEGLPLLPGDAVLLPGTISSYRVAAKSSIHLLRSYY